MSGHDRGIVRTDEPITFSPETEAKLRVEAAVFADMLVKAIPGYDFEATALARRVLAA